MKVFIVMETSARFEGDDQDQIFAVVDSEAKAKVLCENKNYRTYYDWEVT